MSQEKELQVVVAGHICFDVIPAFKKSDKTQMTDIITLFRSVRNIICSEFRSAGAFEYDNLLSTELLAYLIPV